MQARFVVSWLFTGKISRIIARLHREVNAGLPSCRSAWMNMERW